MVKVIQVIVKDPVRMLPPMRKRCGATAHLSLGLVDNRREARVARQLCEVACGHR